MSSLIHRGLQQLRLTGMIAEYDKQLLDTQIHSSSFENRLGLLIEAEMAFKDNRRIHALLRKANLRYSQAALEDVVYKPSRRLDTFLSTNWLRRIGLNIATVSF